MDSVKTAKRFSIVFIIFLYLFAVFVFFMIQVKDEGKVYDRNHIFGDLFIASIQGLCVFAYDIYKWIKKCGVEEANNFFSA